MHNQEAADAQVQVSVPAELRVNTLREALERALANVVRNAVRYAGQHGPIEIYACESPGVQGWNVGAETQTVAHAPLRAQPDHSWNPYLAGSGGTFARTEATSRFWRLFPAPRLRSASFLPGH